jgi:hypothetical protein
MGESTMQLRSLLSVRAFLIGLAALVITSSWVVYIYALQRTAAISYARSMAAGIVPHGVEFAPLPKWWPSSVPVPEWLRSVERVGVGTAGRPQEFCDVSRFAPLYELERLTLVGVDEAGLRSIGRLKNLKTLDLYCSGLTDTGMSAVRDCRQLQSFQLVNASGSVTDAGLEALDGLPLERCRLCSSRITDAGLRCLVQSPLQILDLSGTGVTDAGLSEIATLPLRGLSLRKTEVSDAGLPALAQVPLEHLDLMHTNVTPRGVPAIRAIKTLKNVSVSAPQFKREDVFALKQGGLVVDWDGDEFPFELAE